MKTFKVLVSWSRDYGLYFRVSSVTLVTVKAKDEEEAQEKAQKKVIKQEVANCTEVVECDEAQPKRVTVKQAKSDVRLTS